MLKKEHWKLLLSLVLPIVKILVVFKFDVGMAIVYVYSQAFKIRMWKSLLVTFFKSFYIVCEYFDHPNDGLSMNGHR